MKMILRNGKKQIGGSLVGAKLRRKYAGEKLIFDLPVFQIGVDVGPAATKTGAPWTDVSAFGVDVPALNLATGAVISGVSVKLTGDSNKSIGNLNDTTLNSGSLASGAAPASVLCDGASASGGTIDQGVYLFFQGLDTSLVYRLEVWSMGTATSTDTMRINGVTIPWPEGMNNRAARKAASIPVVVEKAKADANGVILLAIRQNNNPVLNGARLTAFAP